MIKPSDLGLPFPEWRQYQLDAIIQVDNTQAKYILLEAPTGCGKSGIAVGLARLSGADSTAVVCHTLQLQDQYLQIDGLHTVKGRNNFPCLIQDSTAGDAPCTISGPMKCTKYHDCPYYVQLARGLAAQVSVHNYAYWLPSANYQKRFTDLNLLVLDECHLLEDQLRKFVQVELSSWSLKSVGLSLPDYGNDIGRWRVWADESASMFRAEANEAYDFDKLTKPQVVEIQRVRAIHDKLDTLSRRLEDDWLVEHIGQSHVFRPVWVTQFGHQYVFRHAEKILMMSATILDAEHFCAGLGIPAKEAAFFRLPSTFPKRQRPIIFRPATKVGQKSTTQDSQMLVNAVDRILEAHSTEKGLIHTTNYNIAALLTTTCRNKQRLVTHDTKGRGTALDAFKQSNVPLVLVSPSMQTGVDLPYDLCRFIIVAKLPFPNKGDEQVKRRMSLGPDGLPNKRGQSWYMWQTACTLVQSVGRGMRAPDDACVSYIVDGHFRWFKQAVRGMLPSWFTEVLKEEVDTSGVVAQIRQMSINMLGEEEEPF